MRTFTAIAGALALAGCGAAQQGDDAGNAAVTNQVAEPAPAPAPVPVPSPEGALTATGWGPLKVGMTRDEITAALGPDARPDAVGGPEPDKCDQYRPARAPKGMLVMLLDGRLARVSVSEPGTRTDAGIQIGDGADQVKQAYAGALNESPHKYAEAPAQDLIAWTGGKKSDSYVEDPAARGIRYETDARGKVTAIHAGGAAIQLVEGCL